MAWDQQCVELVALLGFDECGIDINQCCELGPGGCGLEYLAECVCAVEPTCCGPWHPLCTQIAIDECNAPCMPPSSCCYAHGDPGCDDESVQACVCEVLEGCCSEMWTNLCVSQALKCGGNSCSG